MSKTIEKVIFAKIAREYGVDTSGEIIELIKNYKYKRGEN